MRLTASAKWTERSCEREKEREKERERERERDSLFIKANLTRGNGKNGRRTMKLRNIRKILKWPKISSYSHWKMWQKEDKSQFQIILSKGTIEVKVEVSKRGLKLKKNVFVFQGQSAIEIINKQKNKNFWIISYQLDYTNIEFNIS